MPCKIFIHGLDSSNKGTKSIFFRQRYPGMIIPYFTGDLPERMKKLTDILNGKTGIRLVGSSFGGLMGTLFTLENEPRVERLVLLAPAINLITEIEHTPQKIAVPVWLYHGIEDDVIPLRGVEKVARQMFSNLTFNEVEDDHFLHRTFKRIDWDALLN
jgi:pimeloyl-ACP methyl ester carboxylesterase